MTTTAAADVSRFPDAVLPGPFAIATARPIGTIAIISDGANPGELHRSTSFPVAGWTVIGGGGGGGETLAQTLVLGNTTGGTDIAITAGDKIGGTAGQPLKVTPSVNEAFDGGSGNTVPNGLVGAAILGKGHSVSAGHRFLFMSGNGHTTTGANYNYNNGFLGGRSNSIGDYAYGVTMLGGYGNDAYGVGGYYVNHTPISGYLNTAKSGNNGFGTNKFVNHSAAMGARNLLQGCEAAFALGMDNNNYSQGSMAGGGGSTQNAYYAFAWGLAVDTHQFAKTSAGFGARTYANGEGHAVWGNSSESPNVTVIPALNRVGSLQGGRWNVGCGTTSAAATVCTTDGTGTETINATGDNTIRVRENQALTFEAKVTAFQTGGAAGTAGDTASWFIQGTVKRVGAGAAALVGTVSGAGVPGANDRDAGAATWDVTVGVAVNRPTFTVTGELNKNIAWNVAITTSDAGAPS